MKRVLMAAQGYSSLGPASSHGGSRVWAKGSAKVAEKVLPFIQYGGPNWIRTFRPLYHCTAVPLKGVKLCILVFAESELSAGLSLAFMLIPKSMPRLSNHKAADDPSSRHVEAQDEVFCNRLVVSLSNHERAPSIGSALSRLSTCGRSSGRTTNTFAASQ